MSPSLLTMELSSHNLLVGVLMFVYGVCSVSMTMINKYLSESFGFCLTLIFIQNLGALFCSVVFSFLGLQDKHPLRTHHMFPMFINGAGLVFMLWSSLAALRLISVPLYVVSSNARPLCTSAIEYFTMGRRFDRFKFMGLTLIVIGAVLYSKNDETSSSLGVGLAFANTVLSASLSVYENSLMNRFKDEQTAFGANYYKLIFSSPVLLFLIFVTEDSISVIQNARNFTASICVSSVLALGLGVIMFALQPLVTATTIQVGNVSFKLVSTLVGVLLFPTDVSTEGWIGYGVCLVGFVLYTFGSAIFAAPRNQYKVVV